MALELLRDLRFGLRLLARSPVFTATSVLLLAIGISANTLIFSVADALLLRQLPVSQPEELVRLVRVHPSGFVNWYFSYDLCEALSESTSGLSQVLCQGQADLAFRDRESVERVRAHLVSPNFFETLGVGAQLGRVLTPEDENAEVMPAVLSDAFWKRRFGSDPAIVGRKLILNDFPFVVVGVTPEGFNGLILDTSPDVRVPAAADSWFAMKSGDSTTPRHVEIPAQIFGRLRPGLSLERAEAETMAVVQSAYEALPELTRTSSDRPTRLEPIANGVSVLREQFQYGLVGLMAGVGFLLVMACANVAGLLLARTAARAPEMGVRLALGASRWRLTRQLLSESLLLTLFGGVAGILLTYAFLPLLVYALPQVRDRMAVLQPLAVHIDIDLRVLTFAVAVTLLSTLLAGLSPALAGARTQVAQAFRSGHTTTRRLSLHKLIVLAQVAACTVLLAGAALLVQTLDRMRSMDAGFDRDHVATFALDPKMKGYDTEQAVLLSHRMLEKVRSLPSVAAASIADRALMRGTGMKGSFTRAGESIGQEDFLNSSVNSVMPGYFETMGMRLVAGRDFATPEPNEHEPKKAIVNQAFVRLLYPDEDPIGKRFGVGRADTIASPNFEIVGVVSDAKYRSLREEIHPTVYSYMDGGSRFGFTLYVRTHQRPEGLIGPVRNILQSLDPELPFVEVHTLRQEVEASLWQERLLAGLSSIFGVIAILLVSIGLYGALDCAVKARTREIGVRSALGAEPARIARLLCGEVLVLVAVGVVLGLAVHTVAAQWLSKALYGVQPSDPLALSSALVLIATAAFLASLPPILQAIRIDPASALRQE